MTASETRADEVWPALPFDEWRETCATLHLYCQIVGKMRLALTPWINHSWHVTLYVTARGLTTSLVPHGSRSFEIELDLVGGAVAIRTTDGAERRLPLVARPVAGFHDALLAQLAELDLPVTIHGVPNEVRRSDPVPRGPRGAGVRSRAGAALLARARPGRPRAERASAPASSARSARSTSSGAASTWR